MEKFGISNIKLLIGLPIELGNIGDAIGKENSKNWKKWLKLVDALDEVVDMIRVDFKALKNEYSDLSDAERVEIKDYLCEKFSIEDRSLEVVIEKSFSILFQLEVIVRDSIALFKNLK